MFIARSLTFLPAVSTSAMEEHDIDPELHDLSTEFATTLTDVRKRLNECTDVDTLKTFLNSYSHPLYPAKRYIEPHVYHNATTVADTVLSLFPQYINYMHHIFLNKIVDKFGDEKCKECLQKYEKFFQDSVRKLRKHPAPLTDEEIEQSSSQKRLKVTTSGDARATTLHNLHTVQEAIEQTTGVSQDAQDCSVQLFHELCDEDLSVLADAGITRIQVEDLQITDINRYTTKGNAAQRTYPSAESNTRGVPMASILEFHLKERQDISNQQCDDLIALLRSVPERQLNEACSEQLLRDFSQHIQHWEVLALFLRVQDFHHDKGRYPGGEEVNYQLLLLWRRREGSRATCYHLLETVIRCGTGQEVKDFIQTLLKGLFCVSL